MFDDGLSPDPEQVALARCIRAVGTTTFYRELLGVAEAVGGFEHLSVFAFSPALEPRMEVLEGLDDGAITLQSARSYLGFGYHGSDPARFRLHALGPDLQRPAMFVLKADEIADAAYRRDIYDRFGLDGRVSMIGQAGGQWRSINFYKHVGRGGITPEDVRALARRSDFLFAAEIRHLELRRERADPVRPSTPSPEILRTLLAAVAPALSAREAEACVQALRGMTGEGTALEMGISEATVATLRRRAYAKLGISNVNELFALCLSEAARGSQRTVDDI